MNAPINSMIDKVVKPVPKPDNITDGQVYATHEGLLSIGGIELEVYVLNTGERVISEKSVKRFLGTDSVDELLQLLKPIN